MLFFRQYCAQLRSAFLGLSFLLVAGCGSDSDPVAGDIVQATDASLPAITAAETKQIITYRMPGVGGELVDATGVVLIPAGTPPDGGWPVVGWGHGTTGVADACAPSASDTLRGDDVYLDSLLQSGIAVVAPDYEGLGSDGGHPYLHLDSEGRSLLYAIRAAVSQYASLGNRYALLGHSQGGHAVIGAAELAQAGEVSGLSLVGVVALAPASQVNAQGVVLDQIANNPSAPLSERVQAAVGRIGFSGLILAGLEAINPGFNALNTYGPDGAFVRDLVATQCTSGIFSDLLAPVQTALGVSNSIAGILPADIDDQADVAAYLEQMEPGFRPISPPVLLLQGDQDTTVFPTSTQQLLTNMSNTGNLVSLELVTGATHSSIRAASLSQTLLFIQDQFANSP